MDIQIKQSDLKGRPKRYILPLKINPDRQNQVDLPYTKARANIVKTSALNIVPQVICDDGCETPAINYSQFNGKPYQGIAIFQEICSEVLTWCQPNTYCSEPVFVPRPDAKSEDDGVLITSVIRGKPEVRYSGLVVLNAEDLVELGRVEFELPGPVPKPLHGCFLPSWDYNPVY